MPSRNDKKLNEQPDQPEDDDLPWEVEQDQLEAQIEKDNQALDLGEVDWGYWTVIDLYEGFKNSGVIPDPTVYNPLARALDQRLSLDELGDLLLELGSYASNLEARLGEESARLTAYGEALDAALTVATTFLDLPKTASEKAKEARALADNPELRTVKRRQIESKALLALLKGWLGSYNKAWESVSRKITQQQGELQHTSGRHG